LLFVLNFSSSYNISLGKAPCSCWIFCLWECKGLNCGQTSNLFSWHSQTCYLSCQIVGGTYFSEWIRAAILLVSCLTLLTQAHCITSLFLPSPKISGRGSRGLFLWGGYFSQGGTVTGTPQWEAGTTAWDRDSILVYETSHKFMLIIILQIASQIVITSGKYPKFWN
jgi:hypothetical protein